MITMAGSLAADRNGTGAVEETLYTEATMVVEGVTAQRFETSKPIPK